MLFLKIAIGLLALLFAWAYVYRTRLIFAINAWVRENIFNDRVALFSRRRMALLLFILGALALFSGLSGILDLKRIRPNIANSILEMAHSDMALKRYPAVVNRMKDLTRSDPQNVEAWELLVKARWVRGEKELARQALANLLRLAPNHPFGKGGLNTILTTKTIPNHKKNEN